MQYKEFALGLLLACFGCTIQANVAQPVVKIACVELVYNGNPIVHDCVVDGGTDAEAKGDAR